MMAGKKHDIFGELQREASVSFIALDKKTFPLKMKIFQT